MSVAMMQKSFSQLVDSVRLDKKGGIDGSEVASLKFDTLLSLLPSGTVPALQARASNASGPLTYEVSFPTSLAG